MMSTMLRRTVGYQVAASLLVSASAHAGLVGYWSLDDGGGSTARDLTENGVSVKSKPIAEAVNVDTGAPVLIGRWAEGVYKHFGGLMDDVRLFAYALGQDEITALFLERYPVAPGALIVVR